MKLYYDSISTTCRPILLFAEENRLEIEYQPVSLMAGEHLAPGYAAINPNCQVPMLEDDGFRLSESSAILKYLADKYGSPYYPTDLRERARVNEMMDWFNTGLYRDLGYGLVYPQLLPHHKRSPEAAQLSTLAWGREHARAWLKILDENWIGPEKTYLCGDAITIADCFGAALITVGELIGCDFAGYPNVDRWLARIKALPSWPRINRDFAALAEKVRGPAFVVI